MAHYAVAAAVLAAAGLRGRELVLGAAWAIVPDLDVVTAVPWTLAAPRLDLSADVLIQGAYLFGHRGFSHTVLAALLTGGGVWAVTRERRWGFVAGGAWASHVVLDGLSPWSITPWWPVSTAELHLPIVTTLDPLLTTVSVAAMVAIAGPYLARRIERVPDGVTRWLSSTGTRYARPLAFASAGVLLVNAAWLGAVAVGASAPFSGTYSSNLPRTTTVVDAGDAWEVTHRWAPFTEGQSRNVEKVLDRVGGQAGQEALATARCTLPGLGPYSPVDRPIWVVRAADDGLRVEAIDLVRNATESGSPRLVFTVVDGTVERVEMTGEDGPDGWLMIQVPEAVVEAARCP